LVSLIPETTSQWDLISNCDINRHWSAMIGQFRGATRGWFCEVAGGQAMLRQDDPEYPDTGVPITCSHCNGRGIVTDETEGVIQCPTCSGVAWWQQPMQAFKHQVSQHCSNCLVPLRGVGHLAVKDRTTTVTESYADLTVKHGHTLQVADSINSESSRLVIQYLGK